MSEPLILRRRVAAMAALAAVCVSMPAHAANFVTKAQDLGALAVPQALVYGTAFNDADPITAGVQLAGIGTLLPTDTFYEDYAFVVPDASFSSISATINLGDLLQISNLQVRLYQGTLQTTTTGPVSAGLMQAWSNLTLTAQGSGTGAAQVIDPITLGPGSYLLEVRGNITGQSGGAYSGVLNVAAVPEPGPLAMLLAGLGVLGFTVRRRR